MIADCCGPSWAGRLLPTLRSRPSSRQQHGQRPRPSKLLCCALLTATTLFNCRSPHHLNDAEGDRRADAHVRSEHLKWGLAGQAATLLAVAAAYCLAHGSPARRRWTTAEAVAGAVCVAGTALRAWCFASLGRLFTYEVGIRSQHELVGSGPYTLLLHPSYTGAAMAALGFCAYVGGMRRLSWALAITSYIAVLLGGCAAPCAGSAWLQPQLEVGAVGSPNCVSSAWWTSSQPCASSTRSRSSLNILGRRGRGTRRPVGASSPSCSRQCNVPSMPRS